MSSPNQYLHPCAVLHISSSLISGSFEHRLLRAPVLGQQVTTECLYRSVFFQQLKPLIDGGLLERVDEMREVGLYLHKRHIRGDHGKMLEQAGTVLQHTLVYIKTADKVRDLARTLRYVCVHLAILPNASFTAEALQLPFHTYRSKLEMQMMAMEYDPNGSAMSLRI